MPEEHTVSDARRRERWIVLAIAIAIALGRSTIFLAWPESYFDSDQAVFGLMAKHLAELRAFPLFMYGQSYLLGVEAWMAAPLFAVLGPSAFALKLPLFLMNGAIVWLLLRALEHDAGLRPIAAAAVSMPFILPAVSLAAVFVEPSGGNLEPFLYVLLIWTLRHRPIPCGIVFAGGFLQREFTLYALIALLAVELLNRRILTAAGLRARGAMLGVAGLTWLAVQGLRPLSSGSGPGTSIDQLYGASNNVLELVSRTCFSPATAAKGTSLLVTLHWPELLGTAPYPLAKFSIESTASQGLTASSWLPAVLVLVAITGIVIGGWRTPRPAPSFTVYLVLTGILSAAGYVIGRCGEIHFTGMRYELLSVLGIVGLSGWFLAWNPPRALAAAWAVALAAWLVVVAIPHVRFAHEYATAPPIPAKRQLIGVLESRGVRYGTADYWIAYYVSFLTRERIVLAATDVQRVRTYNALVEEHAGEAVRLSRRRCAGGTTLIPGVYQCP
jgi:hypothetical protein